MQQFGLFILLSTINLFILYGQQNYKYENFGDKSIILNGNVTGSVSDLGATYYNPARLTTIKEPLFSINGKIYQLNVVKLEDFTQDNRTLKSSDFAGLPHMVAGTFKLKNSDNHYFAYSLLSRNRSDLSATYNTGIQNSDIIDTQPGNETHIGITTIRNKVSEEWYGISWATKVTEDLSIGVSGYFSRYEFSGNNSLEYSSIAEDSTIVLYRSKVGFSQRSYGLFGKIGIAYNISKFELGLNIDLPYLELFSEGEFNQGEFLTGLSTIDDRFSSNSFNNLNAKRKYPLGIQLGTGVEFGKNKAHFNISWNAAKRKYTKISIPELNSELRDLPQLFFQEQLKNVINFGAGLEFYIRPKMNGYVSYSTDFSPYISNAFLFDLTNEQNEDINVIANFNHYGLGIDFSIGRIDLVMGGVLSAGNSNFSRPLSFSNEIPTHAKIKYRRWRILLGLNLTIEKILGISNVKGFLPFSDFDIKTINLESN